MPNPYFRFKQFTIRQDHSAMKVCTDSCILGAWTALRLKESKNILDIGTGTGLLALMLAQASDSFIDAIESDADSIIQARENILLSEWAARVRVLEGDVRHYPFLNEYDFMITNPPFYESGLRSPELKKNQAKHDMSLILEDLLPVISSSLKEDGYFSILLPFFRADYFENLVRTKGFYLQEKLTVSQTPAHAPFRSICLYSRRIPEKVLLNELTIRDAEGKYSGPFSDLMKDYY
jgi:tRNA1Val (adenine37-N6)-methyltransferase